MKKRTRNLLIAAAVLIVAGLWIWRFVTINNYYHGLAGEQEEDVVYSMGDIVPTKTDGYSIRVDSLEFLEYEDVDPELFEQTYAYRYNLEGKYALLHITLFNVDSDKNQMDLSSLKMRGEDTIFTEESVLLTGLNSSLKGGYATLDKGESASFVIPFDVFKEQLPTAWKHLSRYSMYLNLSIHSDIRVQ